MNIIIYTNRKPKSFKASKVRITFNHKKLHIFLIMHFKNNNNQSVPSKLFPSLIKISNKNEMLQDFLHQFIYIFFFIILKQSLVLTSSPTRITIVISTLRFKVLITLLMLVILCFISLREFLKKGEAQFRK